VLLPGLREDDRGGGRGGDGMAEDGGVIFEDPRLTAIIAPVLDFVVVTLVWSTMEADSVDGVSWRV